MKVSSILSYSSPSHISQFPSFILSIHNYLVDCCLSPSGSMQLHMQMQIHPIHPHQSSKDAFVTFIPQIQLSHGPCYPPIWMYFKLPMMKTMKKSVTKTTLKKTTKTITKDKDTDVTWQDRYSMWMGRISRIFRLPVVDLHHPVVMFLCLWPTRTHLACLK